MINFEGKLTRFTLCEQIVEKIEETIISEDLYNKSLPSEQALCEQFGVSRTIIREALKILDARGLVHSKAGGGSYVTKPQAEDISKLLITIIRMNKISDSDVCQMRLILDVAAARAAAVRITDEELKELDEQVNSMERNMYNIPVRIDKDIEFHVMIGKLSGNFFLALIVESMTDVLRNFIQRGIETSGGNEDGIYRHRMILDALRTKDPDKVEINVRKHIEHSLANVVIQQQGLGADSNISVLEQKK